MKRKLILLTAITCMATNLIAQNNKHFSMFSETRIQTNPAMSGFFKSKYRVQSNYRQQWTTAMNPFTTYSAAFDGRFYEDDFATKFVAGGMYFYNDYAGDNIYSQTQIIVPVSYAIRLDEFNYLSFGISPGFFQRRFGNPELTWGSQWDGERFDTEIKSGETILGDKYSIAKVDFGAGIYWETEIDEFNYMGFGISGNHLSRAKVNLLEENLEVDKIRMKPGVSFQYYGVFGREDINVTFKPNVMYEMQGVDSYLMFGSNFDILLRGSSIHTGYYDRASLEFGTHLRLNDAVVLSGFLHTGALTVGYAYDINVSGLSEFIGVRGASEFYLSFRIGNGRRTGSIELEDE